MTNKEALNILDNQIGYDCELVAEAKKKLSRLVEFIDTELPIFIEYAEKIFKDSEESIKKFTNAKLNVATLNGAFYHDGLMQGKLDILTYISNRFTGGQNDKQ